MSTNLDQLAVTTLRMLALDTIQKANSGHPGLPLGAAPLTYVLFDRTMKFNPRNPAWFDRDRFILSAGHGSALLYSLLYLYGYEKMTLEELKNFRQWGSKTPGHPEYDIECGIETTTGPLGQGFATGVGMAIAEAHLAARFNRPGFEIINHYTYALVSDGDLMEGVAAEAASLAGHLKLGKLIYLFDNNRISLSGETAICFTEDIKKRFEACGWQVLEVLNGNNLEEIQEAIEKAKACTDAPSLIMVSTHIGYGSPKQDTFHIHGSPLKPEEVIETKKFYNWPADKEFYVPDEVLQHTRQAVERGERAEKEWKELFEAYAQKYPELAKELKDLIAGILPEGWEEAIPVFKPEDGAMATRSAGGKVLNALAEKISALIGGSADLDPSTNTVLKGKGSFQAPGVCNPNTQGIVDGPLGYEGRNIAFGVREHAMGAILNGIALHGGLIPFGATFFVFSDYMRPAVRIAALSKCKTIYVWTHDSVGVGEDGPTHQPVEHLASLRAVPNLVLIRPADANEVAQAWRVAIKHQGGPVGLVLTRQKLPIIDRKKYASAENLEKGAYVIADCAPEEPQIIIIATGSEVHLALEAYEKLSAEGIKVRVVSMPSWELFEAQSAEYKASVLPEKVKKRIAIEAGSTLGWHKYVGEEGIVIGIDRFGASAPGKEVLEKLGISTENLINKARELLGKK
ncbi:transketolase [Thermatribacter velox]|uniref:Transketolase n=1 Tax=Thermatribacter velox TaxID=3039681 RepID=A0ABZ2YAU4_9BACT